MKNYLVTGATGFIGSRLINLLSNSECRIKIISRYPHDYLDTIICDLQKEDPTPSVFDSVDTVFHLAGFTHDMRDEKKVKHLYKKINIDATIKIANLAAEKGVKSFVFVSSVKAGNSNLTKSSDSSLEETGPQGIYGKTKREAELKLLELSSISPMHISIIRPALVYGPSVKGNLASMLSGVKKGWFPPLPKISNCRSMIHVDDLVRALLLVANDDRANGEIYIATDGKSYNSREIYESMCGILNKPIPNWSVPKIIFNILAIISPRMKHNVNKLLGDEYYSSKKLQLLGFKPNLTIKEMNETSF
jgi:UDP-glucose 4-epimerase